MPVAAQILAVLAALIHVFFFYLESIAWSKPSTWKTFGLKSQDEAEVTKGLALNQGFYNLFLAIGVIVGVVVVNSLPDETSIYAYGDDLPWWSSPFALSADVVTFCLLSMLAAALVLLISSKGKMARGAAIQGLLPAVALLVIALA
jgi:putative membrane protein